ncbi:hypothetical protein [Actinomadura fibrosa]|uniref:Uncharacterized protein n=1 Tax=Actinomadura fibrosa TaxID=111802 RepID=A0ABW2XAD3_9ACTN|nr:hypothetical protein [Actinomadura fibrosa]
MLALDAAGIPDDEIARPPLHALAAGSKHRRRTRPRPWPPLRSLCRRCGQVIEARWSQKKHNDPPTASVIIRTIRIGIGDDGVPKEFGTEQRDRIIQAVVEETTHAINDETARPGNR